MVKTNQSRKKIFDAKSGTTSSEKRFPIFALLLPALIITFLYFTNVLDPTLMPKYLAIMGFLIVSFIGYSLILNSLPLIESIKNYRFLALFLVFITLTSVSLTKSTMIGDGIFEWSKSLMSFGLVLFWFTLFEKSSQPVSSYRIQIARLIGGVGLLIGILGLYQWIGVLAEYGFRHDKFYLVSGYFAHRNILCESLFLCLPFSLYGTFFDKGYFRSLHISSALSGFTLCIGLLSRGIWIAVVLSVIFTLILSIYFERKNPDFRNNPIFPFVKKTIYTGGIIILAVIGLGAVVQLSTITGFIDSLSSINYYQNSDRIQKWTHSLTMFYEHPFSGIGIGNWKIDILRFPPIESEAEYGLLYFQRPHNDYLWVLSESGIFAFLAFCGIFMYSLFMIVVALRKKPDIGSRIWLYLLFMGIIGYMIFSFFSFPKERVEEIVLLSLILASILIEYARSGFHEAKKIFSPHPTNRIVGGVLVGILTFIFYVGYERTKGEMILKKYQAVSNTQVKEAIRLAEEAYGTWYQMDPISAPIRFFSGTGYLKLKDYKTAIIHFEEAKSISPWHVQVLNNLAGCYYSEGQTEKAENIYTQIITLAPKYTDALLSYGVVLFNKKTKEDQQKGFVITAKIDTSEKKEQYKFQLNAMREKVMSDIIAQTQDSLLKNEVIKTMNNRNLFVPIARRALNGKRTFETQLYAETLYLLYQNKSLSVAEWENLKTKYNCNFTE